ncbi:MAG TPA: DUF2628 domain-containing protein [Bauldia sp.]|nr:DUF2628 domain-containing protein [Bauldia sp.]
MPLYTVHAPKTADGSEVDPAELVFVKDGFCWPALLIAIPWLVYRRLWLTLVLYLVALVALSIVAGLAGSDASIVVIVLFAFWFALEANGFRRWTLERHGHVLLGVVEGRTLEEAERRFFGTAEFSDRAETSPTPSPGSAMVAAPPSQAVPKPPPPRAEAGIVGLFPSPGIRR